MSVPSSFRKFAFPALGLAFTAIGAAYAGPSAGLVVSTIASSLTWFGGVMGNRSDALLFGEPKVPSAVEVFENRHLRALLRRTIEVIVQRSHNSKSDSEGMATDILREASTTLGQAFCSELDDSNGAFQSLGEFQVPDILNAFAKEQGDISFLTPEVWLAFIDRHVIPPAATETKHLDLWQSERTGLANALHTQFGTALWNLVNEDAATDRRAFAAVQLHYFSRILEAVKNTGQQAPLDLLPIISSIDDLLPRIDQRLRPHFDGIHVGLGNLMTQVTKGFGDQREADADFLTEYRADKDYSQRILTEFRSEFQQFASELRMRTDQPEPAEPQYIGALLDPKQLAQLQQDLKEANLQKAGAAKSAAYALMDALSGPLRQVDQLANGESTFVAFKNDRALQEEVFPVVVQVLQRFCQAAKNFTLDLPPTV